MSPQPLPLAIELVLDELGEPDPVALAVRRAGIPARTLKRRFRAATGSSLIERVQNLRVERAKRLLESTRTPVDEVGAEVGYEDGSFFRRLFRRRTGLSPAQYRRMFDDRALPR